MEIIERKSKVKKTVIDPESAIQVSYNSHGHLVIRFFKPDKENEDTVLVFTASQTRAIIRFVKNSIGGLW
ncbi:MAG: hypothetical protein DRP12_00275 [Candidatus Aenigmatarchaeota archaeon]|nr:MAG: hypothetical protein DRP12_00275 [Candidatus Aenigmarchaeota archaeon]